jgi:hypothetical protein
MYSEKDVELYDEYLSWIRKTIIDEYELGYKNPYELDLEVIEKTMNGMRFQFGSYQNGMYTFETLDFDAWLIMSRRDERLIQLGL